MSGHSTVAYDKNEAPARVIYFILIVLFTIFLIGMAASWVIWKLSKPAEAPAPTVFERQRRRPPEPRLEENEGEELERLRTEDHRQLSSYAWTDEKHTTARIPIDRAIELISRQNDQIESRK